MALKTTVFDPAKYLDSAEAVAGYLQAELDENEPAYWPETLTIIARARGGFGRMGEETSLPTEALELASVEGAQPDRELMLTVLRTYQRIDSMSAKVA